MTTTHAMQLSDWTVPLKLINERFPILLQAGDKEIRERIQEARLITRDGGEVADLELATYRGRRLQFRDIAQVELRIEERDQQGVPVVYEIELTYRSGEPSKEVLKFYA